MCNIFLTCPFTQNVMTFFTYANTVVMHVQRCSDLFTYVRLSEHACKYIWTNVRRDLLHARAAGRGSTDFRYIPKCSSEEFLFDVRIAAVGPLTAT